MLVCYIDSCVNTLIQNSHFQILLEHLVPKTDNIIMAAVRLKFLIAINVAIKKIILVNLTISRKVKTRQYVSIIIQSTVHFTQKSQPNTRVQSQMLALRLLPLQAQPVI